MITPTNPSRPLHRSTFIAENLTALAYAIADRLMVDETIARGARYGEIVSTTNTCLKLASALMGRRGGGEILIELEQYAARCAHNDVPLAFLTGCLHKGMRILLDELAQESGSPADREIMRFLFEALLSATTAVSRSYLRELARVGDRPDRAVHAVAAALLSGRDPTILARSNGITIAEKYWVFAAAFTQPLEDRAEIRRWWSGRHNDLAVRYPDVLVVAGPRGATLLVPTAQLPAGDTTAAADDFFRTLDREVHLVVLQGAKSDLRRTADHAHELVTLARRRGLPPGLYRLDDLAIEHLLSQPGTERDHLAAIVAPIIPVPHLLETLRRHVHNNLDRRRTATDLTIHVNTLDYRLSRIQQLTGLDVRIPDQLFRIRMGLIAHENTGLDERPPPAMSAAAGR
ncbi:PucR family transcriptional regulator [Nocardia aurantia]|uniref:PucR family transcriptional regulator n=1 Tax=Nocardia aurantia TaxID=2585199 RepID=A0A7K0DRA6_9NOCA|nr:helix-turn-helix domain-containing protein [Nocardia aurantia]MQY27354.1 hypothetical protein [Nocardia aurantia]